MSSGENELTSRGKASCWAGVGFVAALVVLLFLLMQNGMIPEAARSVVGVAGAAAVLVATALVLRTRGVRIDLGPMPWPIVIIACILLGATIAILAEDGYIPSKIGTPLWFGCFVAAALCSSAGARSRRNRDWELYRRAGFRATPEELLVTDSVAVRRPFELPSGRRGYSTHGRIWLPESPQVYIYDLHAGGRAGHIIALPTAAPDAVLARDLELEEVKRTLHAPERLVVDDDGFVGSSGDVRGVVAEALPPHPGILVTREGRAHWLIRQPLTPDQLKEAIICLQRLPPRDHDYVESSAAGSAG